MNGSRKFVRECFESDCPLHALRMGRAVKGVSPLRSIRAMCVDCQGGSSQSVRECDPNLNSGEVCPLHPYRLGKGNRALTNAEREQRQSALNTAGQNAVFQAESAAKE
jgi:hypothetical protein